MTFLSLFSGIGGLDLAAEWAGMHCVGQCEWADYPTLVLEKHWPDVPRWKDIRTLTGDDLFARTGCRTVDLVCGGFPCQPFSTAGKRRGKEDDRYLWPEMLRVIRETRPTWVVGENVAGIISMELDTVLSDLEAEGYATRTFVLPACGVDAPHRRYRVAIVAHAGGGRFGESNICGEQSGRTEAIRTSAALANANEQRPQRRISKIMPKRSGQRIVRQGGTSMADTARIRWRARRTQSARQPRESGAGYGSAIVSNTNIARLQVSRPKPEISAVSAKNGVEFSSWWPIEPDVGRVAHGVADRVDRLKCLGNAVVPQQFYPVFQAIAEIERTLL